MECASQAGSGSLPAREIPSAGLRLVPTESRVGTVGEVSAQLRRGEPAILARVRDDGLLLDLRTLEEDEVRAIEERLRSFSDPADR